jgi:hypothetical protein
MSERLYQLWYFDLRARRRLQLLTVLIGFSYGVFNSLVLGRPEGRVTWETMGVIFSLTILLSVAYCFKKDRVTEASVVKFSYEHLGELIAKNRRILEWGLVTSAVVLVMAFTSRFVPRLSVQAAGFDMRLSRAVSSVKPLDKNSIDELTTIFSTARADKVSVNPRLLHLASKKITEASQQDPHAWPAALALLDYRSSLNDQKPTYPKVVCIDLQHGGAIVVNSSFLGCQEVLDGSEWKNVVFEDSTVVYHGGPVILENVQFKHCQFNFDYTPASQELASHLTMSDTVTMTVPGR